LSPEDGKKLTRRGGNMSMEAAILESRFTPQPATEKRISRELRCFRRHRAPANVVDRFQL